MRKEIKIRHGRHVVFNLHVHLVFVTQYRKDVFSKATLEDLHHIFAHICNDFEADLVEFDGEDDHVHLLVHYLPKVALSNLVNSLKGVYSRRIRQKNDLSIKRNLWGGVLRLPSYFAVSCDGAPIDIGRQYIEQQKTPHQERLCRSRLYPALKDRVLCAEG